jgi:prepilin-type N-terminal cleavage/methylation domain-containing protein
MTPKQTGFTLVEVLVAIVVLVFGLMAVTNLLLVAASSNTVAKHGTSAAAQAAAQMEVLKATPFTVLQPAATPGVPPGDLGLIVCPSANCVIQDVPGVGQIQTRWLVETVPGRAQALMIRVRSEGQGALTGARSRAEYTSLRACTDVAPTRDCPPPP